MTAIYQSVNREFLTSTLSVISLKMMLYIQYMLQDMVSQNIAVYRIVASVL